MFSSHIPRPLWAAKREHTPAGKNAAFEKALHRRTFKGVSGQRKGVWCSGLHTAVGGFGDLYFVNILLLFVLFPPILRCVTAGIWEATIWGDRAGGHELAPMCY